jgi:hypothetical protein
MSNSSILIVEDEAIISAAGGNANELLRLGYEEKYKWRSHKNESADTRHRRGTIRGGDIVSVMEME